MVSTLRPETVATESLVTQLRALEQITRTETDAALQQAERAARRDGAVGLTVHEARSELGSLKASEFPVEHDEEMTASAAVAALRQLTGVDDLNAMIAFEESHRNRSGVISAAQTHYAEIAQRAAGIG